MTIQLLLGPNGLVCYTEDENRNVQILWGGRVFYSFNRKDTFAGNLGIALLANLGVLKKTISEMFRVNRRTVKRVHEVYRREGVEGLKEYRKGPQRVEEGLKAFVIEKYVELDKKWGYQQAIVEAVHRKVEEGIFRKGISRSTLQQIIRAHKDKVEGGRKEEAEAEAQRREIVRGRRGKKGGKPSSRGWRKRRGSSWSYPKGGSSVCNTGALRLRFRSCRSLGWRVFCLAGRRDRRNCLATVSWQ